MLVSGQSIYVGSSEISKVFQGDDLIWSKGTPPAPVSGDYLTFEILTGGTINWKLNTEFDYTGKTIYYSKNSGATWNAITATTGGTSFNVSSGDKVYFKGENSSYYVQGTECVFSDSTAYFNVSGNILSLIYGDSFSGQTGITEQYTFRRLFQNTNVVSSVNLQLPLNVTKGCYDRMFYNCVLLTAAPVLPATTLADSCYYYMFGGCNLLAATPSLPATTLGLNCYLGMFYDCNHLIVAPSLPATTLADGCYQDMFKGCDRLATAPELLAPVLGIMSYSGMFWDCPNINYVKCLATDRSAYKSTHMFLKNVAEYGTFVKDPSMNDWPIDREGVYDTWGVPEKWTIIDNQ